MSKEKKKKWEIKGMFVLLNLGHNQMLRWQGIVGGGIRGIYREGEGRKL